MQKEIRPTEKNIGFRSLRCVSAGMETGFVALPGVFFRGCRENEDGEGAILTDDYIEKLRNKIE